MGWKEDVRHCIQQFESDFSLDSFERFLPRLHIKHPRNNNIDAKIRQQLQVLRDEGEIEFLGNGKYRNLSTRQGLRFKIDEITTREEISKIIGKGAQSLNRGMFKAADGPFSDDLLLFSHADSIYGDSLEEGERFLYIGQGKPELGDQKLDSFNLILANHLENSTRVHLFINEDSTGPSLRYNGTMVVDTVERVFREAEGRSILQFGLIPDHAGSLQKEFNSAYDEVLHENLKPHTIDRPTKTRIVKQNIRDRAFASHIKRIYEEKCAVCHETIRHPTESWFDLEAAHVRSVAADGCDALNNGIALCARHHKAFDNGIFSLTDEYSVIMTDKFVDPHEEIIKGLEIHCPSDDDLRPHPEYLTWHRNKSRITG